MLLRVLDASNVICRLFYGRLGDAYLSDERKLVQVCAREVRRAIGDDATHAALACDAPGSTWRHQLVEETRETGADVPPYKAKPENEKPPALQRVLREVPELLWDNWGVRAVEVSGFEADDVVASLVALAVKAGAPVVIQSNDKDLQQLEREDPLVELQPNGAGQQLKRPVPAAQVPDYLALVGDTSDGYRGVPGVGPVAAKALLEQYGSLDACLRVALATRPDEWFSTRLPLRAKLREHAEEAHLCLRLATLRPPPLELVLEDLVLTA